MNNIASLWRIKSKTRKQLPGTKGEKRERWNDGRWINPCNAALPKKERMYWKEDRDR